VALAAALRANNAMFFRQFSELCLAIFLCRKYFPNANNVIFRVLLLVYMRKGNEGFIIENDPDVKNLGFG
jgi:hypothetical protein